MKNIRADLLIATLALLASSGATLSSVYQTHVIANQLSASVWPYLEAVYSLSSSTAKLEVANDGLGPALVRSATLAVDGHTVASYRRGIDVLERGFTCSIRTTAAFRRSAHLRSSARVKRSRSSASRAFR